MSYEDGKDDGTGNKDLTYDGNEDEEGDNTGD